jgi:hypothetical protein
MIKTDTELQATQERILLFERLLAEARKNLFRVELQGNGRRVFAANRSNAG